jgi:WhiB family redox-sensing transcriptional regulator
MDEWMEHARCRGRTSLFFPLDENGASARQARIICQKCPVRDACLESALSDPTLVGIWAGTSTRERRRMRRQRRAA